MCGIAGFIDFDHRLEPLSLNKIAAAMGAELRHRGPDDAGVWVDCSHGVAFAHSRLSIIDLSPLGHQPMISHCGRFVITFNGEIYNFRALREELAAAGYTFRGSSDTEVLLCSIARWGLDGALPRLNGMFGFALWDRVDKTLYLVRDRLGEKPLYYTWTKSFILFGSELRSLVCHPSFVPEIDQDALSQFMQLGYVPSPMSIYRNVFKLPAATVLCVKPGSTEPTPRRYWSLDDAVLNGSKNAWASDAVGALDYLDDLLRDAVRIRMESDVPLGAFLSGGIDSSTIVALMQAQSQSAIKTFTVGFQQDTHDESRYAAAIAKHFGTDHAELVVNPAQALEIVPLLPRTYDEPFADASQIPTCLISRMARGHVTVALSGDGGDELFCGYRTYRWGATLGPLIGQLPGRFRRVGAAALSHTAGRLPGNAFGRKTAQRLRLLTHLMRSEGESGFYRALTSTWHDPNEVVVSPATERAKENRDSEPRFPDLWHRMMYWDTTTYLPDDILTKVDRASMSVGLECRVPLLDHRVLEFAWRLPLNLKMREGQSKWILRQVLARYAPLEWFRRPKMGFTPPLADWLRGPLREWAEDLLEEHNLKKEGFLRHRVIAQKWKEHLEGKQSWTGSLWTVLMFQAWLNEQKVHRCPPV